MLQACLNGDRNPDFHARVPCTAAELAADARDCIAAGADELHIHPRDSQRRETLDPNVVAETIGVIRQAVPGVPIGLSTHWRIPPGGLARQRSISAWSVLPDYVSINLIEPDAADMIALVLSKGIAVEAGLWSVADARRFVALRQARSCLRVLIEMNEQDVTEGLQVATGILAVLEAGGMSLPILLHGDQASAWPMFRQAIIMGHDTRIGLEDDNCLPDGEPAAGNAELIRAAVELAHSLK
ncbi:3-keto-5-aminohexanoate cleavage protein [Phyllobacterium sp. 0TCS1.6C]|uniref:3-keto-5-aminohexanoate cleavage protein n=1 Tax=unclassified Phyllobacterium TaxID=2638441 RepID=UPI002263C53F|nr:MULTISPECIES: 3-keto-5-aminohexanoate cleavage protein [unclassified Phyllobacterium]MCX8281683.1 3-keto-5-aminohexanoate cleavage protein [Phyllobacterium sp. 0TCS1.6C]MCX8294793.1 3-keto-5-aminohexanoate cleavage protein [Phyllobacterium sp. 0TCS1.6A]